MTPCTDGHTTNSVRLGLCKNLSQTKLHITRELPSRDIFSTWRLHSSNYVIHNIAMHQKKIPMATKNYTTTCGKTLTAAKYSSGIIPSSKCRIITAMADQWPSCGVTPDSSWWRASIPHLTRNVWVACDITRGCCGGCETILMWCNTQPLVDPRDGGPAAVLSPAPVPLSPSHLINATLHITHLCVR